VLEHYSADRGSFLHFLRYRRDVTNGSAIAVGATSRKTPVWDSGAVGAEKIRGGCPSRNVATTDRAGAPAIAGVAAAPARRSGLLNLHPINVRLVQRFLHCVAQPVRIETR